MVTYENVNQPKNIEEVISFLQELGDTKEGFVSMYPHFSEESKTTQYSCPCELCHLGQIDV